jgi:hypothetical protein
MKCALSLTSHSPISLILPKRLFGVPSIPLVFHHILLPATA